MARQRECLWRHDTGHPCCCFYVAARDGGSLLCLDLLRPLGLSLAVDELELTLSRLGAHQAEKVPAQKTSSITHLRVAKI